MKCKKFLFAENGFTLVGVVIQAVIIAFAAIGLHIGIVFCEKELARNNHRRAVYLLASGFMEEQVYFYSRYKVFRGGANKSVTINPEKEGATSALINVTLQRSSREYTELIDNRSSKYTRVQVKATWQDPLNANRTRSVTVVEDLY